MKKVKSVSGLKVVFYYAGHVQPVASLLFWCQKRMGGRLTLSFCHAHTYPLHSEFGMCVCECACIWVESVFIILRVYI